MREAKGSLRWAVVPLVFAAVPVPFAPVAGGCAALLILGVVYFHRDPDRETPPSGGVAPALGRRGATPNNHA